MPRITVMAVRKRASYPSTDMHKMLLENCYEECGVDIILLEYFEAHGTGTEVSFIKCETDWLGVEVFVAAVSHGHKELEKNNMS
jgi:hypothetical protein